MYIFALVICAILIVGLVVVIFLMKNKLKKLSSHKNENLDETKNRFLSNISHEIRTSLNNIVGFSECIKLENDIDNCKVAADDIIVASQSLLETMNKILYISKIKANKLEIVESEYKPVEVFEKIVKRLNPTIDRKNVELKMDFDQDIPYVLLGDIIKLKQIIINLLTNAIKYTESGEIIFKVKCSNEKDICDLTISVEDTGIGIKEEQIDKLFNKFERLEEDKNVLSQGTGLGLAISKSLLEMMGGKISVESKYGQYSKFTINLKQQIKIKSIPLITEITKLEESIKPKVYDYSSKRILIVDDNKVNLKVITRLLKSLKIETVNVESGFKCLDEIKNGEKYDLILMDDMMPKISGVETLKKLKEIEDFNVPVIVLTANVSSGTKEKYIKAGFKDYLSKPIDKFELNRILETYLTDKIESMEDTVLFSSSTKIKSVSEDILSEIDDDDKIKEKSESHSEFDEEESNPDKLNEDSKLDKFDEDDIKNQTEETIEEETIEEEKEIEDIIEEDEVKTNYKNKQYLIDNGVNIELSESLLNQMSTFDDALQDFMEDASKKLKVIKICKEKSDFKSCYGLIRTLKTDVRYLGFEKLYALLYNFEKRLKLEDTDFLNNNIDEVIDEFERLINISKEYLGKNEAVKNV